MVKKVSVQYAILATMIASVSCAPTPQLKDTSSTPEISLASPTASTSAISASYPSIRTTIDKIYPELSILYKDLHKHPEIAFEEYRTAGVLSEKMKSLGFEVVEGIGKTGIVAILRNGDGPTILVRTDMDALPMQEKTGLTYASAANEAPWRPDLTPGTHACGHDINMTTWVGTATVLSSHKDKWSGTLMFIGQPAEETLSGAKAMLEDGLIEKFPKPDLGFALHTVPLPAGTIIVKPGLFSSSSDTVEVKFTGIGAHGSMPEQSIDPIVIAARFVTSVQAITSREKSPGKFGVITVGAFNSGAVANIIPSSATLKLTLRSHDEDVRALLLDGVRRTAKAAAIAAGAPEPEITVTSSASAVYNDLALADRTSTALKTEFGPRLMLIPAAAPPGPASEDYSEFVAAGIPSLYFGVGALSPAQLEMVKRKDPLAPIHHSPYFTPDPEPTIKAGVQAMSLALLNELSTTDDDN